MENIEGNITINDLKELYSLDWWVTDRENKPKTISLQAIAKVGKELPFSKIALLEEGDAVASIMELNVMNHNQAVCLVRHICSYPRVIEKIIKDFRLEQAELNIKNTFNQFLNCSAFATELADTEDLTKTIAQWWPIYNAYSIGKRFNVKDNVVEKYYRNIFSVSLLTATFTIIFKPEIIGSSIQFNQDDIDTYTELKTRSLNDTYLFLIEEFIRVVSDCAKAVYRESQSRL